MERFTISNEEYKVISKLKKRQDKANLCLAIMEFMFDDKEPENLSEIPEMAFEIILPTLKKSKNNSGRGGRPKSKIGYKTVLKNENRFETDLKPIENRFETDLKPIENRFETERETVPNEKERTKEKETTLERENLKERKKKIYINNNQSACACVEDFSKMTDEELIAWGEGRSVCFDNAEDVDSLYAWNEEMEKRANETEKWSGKLVVRDGGLERLKSHAEIMTEFDVSNLYRETLKEFLRHCYANRHLVTNEKLTDIILRLDDAFGDDDEAKCYCIERAIRGGYFDVRA